jgi:hypothetical protein
VRLCNKNHNLFSFFGLCKPFFLEINAKMLKNHQKIVVLATKNAQIRPF